MKLPFVFFALFTVCHGTTSKLNVVASTDDDYSCSATKPCDLGCCSKTGVCGFGPDYCSSDNCISSCDAKSECDPGWGAKWSNASTCPLNVCCSQFGFCGTTPDFCGSKTVVSPSCGGTSSDSRTIGYYEGWNLEHDCGTMKPKQIPLGYYTHINYAFAYIDPNTFRMAPMAPDVASHYKEVTALKRKQPNLRVWIAIGGWSFNNADEPTATTFSDLARSSSAQEEFFASLITSLVQNDFDGVDLDWEYPVAADRSGRPEDFKNFPIFLEKLRRALDGTGLDFGLSITIPSSYWYMQHFDIVKIDPIIDWFNIMTYDLHGTWDGKNPYIGNVALAHTNLTEIEQSLELLWRNHIDPHRVNLGLGFYGRSFTMSDPNCLSAGCPFSGGGMPGPCTGTSGILSNLEIRNVIESGATVTLDPVAAVKIVTWDKNQWVSYDDVETIKMKVDFANQHCLGGTMIWAIDMDDRNGTSINGLGSDLSRGPSPIYNKTLSLPADYGWS